MMDLSIDPALKAKWPATRLGVIQYTAQVTPSIDALWSYIGATTIPAILRRLDAAPLAEFDNLRQSRAAYRAFGKDPTRHRISSEALIRRIRKDRALYRVNSAVDTGNLVSLESGFSVGCYDADSIHGPVVLRIGRGSEHYDGIGKGAVNIADAPVLADAVSAFGGATSDSARTMVTSGTRCVLTVIYSFSENKDLEIYLQKAGEWLARFANAHITAQGVIA